MDWQGILAVCATVISVAATITNLINGKSKDDKSDATHMALVDAKLETMSKNIEEIKSDIKSLRHDNALYGNKIVEHDNQIKTLFENEKAQNDKLNKLENFMMNALNDNK